MSIIADLNEKMPTTLNKTTAEYLAIFGNETFTPEGTIDESSDYNCGAIANELEYAQAFDDYITRTQNIDSFYGDYLERILYFFTGLLRDEEETDSSLRLRFKALCIRQNNPSWLTTWSIRDAFKYFFDEDIIYVIENNVFDQWVGDDSFESGLWSIVETGSSTIDIVDDNMFDQGKAAEFNVDAAGSSCYIEQTFADPVSDGDYMLSFFMKDETPDINTLVSKVYPASAASTWYSICWSPELGLFCALALAGTGRVMTSPDGKIWTTQTTPSGYGGYSVCWSPELGLFCTVGGSIVMTSPDGETWTQQTPAELNNWRAVCWSPELGLFCAVSLDGTNRVMTSPDGEMWTARNIGTGAGWASICWSPDLGLFCVFGSIFGVGAAKYSSDGVSWNNGSLPASNVIRASCWSPELGIFVAVPSSGTGVLTSADGITWTQRTGVSASWWGVCWSSELEIFVAVADSGSYRIMFSDDGITWYGLLAAEANAWQWVCWSPELNVFCATATSGTNRVQLSSFMSALLKVFIQRAADSFYYNFDTKTWAAGVSYKYFGQRNSDRYEICQAYVKMATTDSLTLRIENAGGYSSSAYTLWIDKVEFGTKVGYPTIKVILINIGSDPDFISLWEGTGDPIPGEDYDFASFLGQCYISGLGGIGTLIFYDALLSIIKPFGVHHTIQVIEREE